MPNIKVFGKKLSMKYDAHDSSGTFYPEKFTLDNMATIQKILDQ